MPDTTPLYNLFWVGVNISRGDFSLEGGGTLPYPVKENPIGSAVKEILRYKETDSVLLCIIDGT